mmetsp:Transcript_33645/g.80110  ORF Transcript_33645/g.80110 Transcript_33645/m.80110 type:complete len:448 (+) Transcript_33645:51-1394(+)
MTVAGLEEALVTAGLQGHVSGAAEWCVKMGARDLEEISEDEVFDEFVDALGLKPLEKRRLRKALAAAAPPAPADAAAAPSLSKAPSLVAVPGAPSNHTVFVKNTFLDLQEPPRLSDLRRLNTAPAPAVAFEDDEAERAAEDEEEDEAEEPGDLPAASEGGSAEGGRSPAPPDGLYKMATYDGYDSWEEWNWLTSGGDPNSHAGVGQGAHGSACAPLPEAAQYEAPLDPAFAGPVGMVMVPTDAMLAPVMMPAMAPGMCLPGCTLVPMDRFTRWPDGMGVDDGSYGLGPEKKEREQALQKAFSVASRISRVRWTVDARRLKSKDREAASPTFELSCGSPMEFKMVIHPRKVEDARGGASFKKAQGKGTVQLRILSRVEDSASAVVTFRLAVGSSSKQSEPRGPVRHDFSERPICGLPEGRDEWDFQKAVDKATQTFVVCLEVLMGTAE